MMQLGGGGGQMLILSQNMKSESGKKVQQGNIHAAKTIADVIRTCLGPKSMLKMLMDPMGGIVMTNDGNAILREIQVQHPAAKSMIEISRTQDEEVGDGTTSVIVLAGEVMTLAEPFLQKGIHPTVIISGYRQALEDLVTALRDRIAITVDTSDTEALIGYIQSSVQTKMVKKWSRQICEIALGAVQTVSLEQNGRKEIDIKRYARVEKIPGGSMEDSRVLDGILLNKDVVHPRMRRRIENPRIVLLDCNLEYKKGESQTNIEMNKDEDFIKILQLEEEFVRRQCDEIIALKPDLVLTEKGVSDLAQHFLVKSNISCLRRLKKTDNNRVARAVGANIVSDTADLKEEDVGLGCGLFEIKKIGDEYFSYIVECKNPKACTLMLRGPSKDILNEIERNLQDAMQVSLLVISKLNGQQ
ncbi:T-complex protein 1 subunit gamma-like [Oopsacas minuta]|uniref:T-complex protein 1 subunit gamma n=1 Tax=Oopsacas minuta TaxID=111878 RepID=A0AAV7JEJ5_9METZ|nr:T-complex protein 1 subunit gamma-like [Oopsacas minuta]